MYYVAILDEAGVMILSSICEKRCDKCILKETCGGCSLCEASVCRKCCNECAALCPMRPEAVNYLNKMGGPTFNLQSNNDFAIPYHIPIVPDRLSIIPKYEIMPMIGVHAGTLLARNGQQVNKRYLEKGLQGALNVDKRCEAILEFYVKDRTLEGFWDNRNEVYRGLKQLNFKSVISANFSVYEDAPRLDHLYNIKRTTIVYNELLDNGINAIPDVSWYNRRDLERWRDEINKNNIKVIAFSFQVVDVQLKASNIWKSYMLGFRYLCQNIDPGVKIIVIGVASHRRLQEIFKAANGQSIHVLNQSAYIQSTKGMISENRISELNMPKEDIFENNIIYFNKIYEQMNNLRHKEGEYA